MDRRRPLRRRSPQRQRLYQQKRIPLVIRLLADSPPCQRCQRTPATDLHELKTRARGGSITDPDNIALLCRPCHDWVTTHPAEAHAEGWLKHSWE